MNTITAWRISPAKYRDTAFSGEGAKEYGGRFNSVGTPMVYTSESLALATLGLLARTNKRQRLAGREYLSVTFPEKHVTIYDADDLPGGWDARPYGPASQHVGDAWTQAQTSLIARVPSVVVPSEHNYLINPQHPDAGTLTFGEPAPLQPDPRLLEP